jgi:hypothetical protein
MTRSTDFAVKGGIRANEAEADAWLNEHWAKVLGAHNRGQA